jgi:hypothetical protein
MPDREARLPSARSPRRNQDRGWRASRDDQEEDLRGRGPAGYRADLAWEAASSAHEYGNAVKHVAQRCFELCLPAILREPGCQAMHRRETPGVNHIHGIKQIAQAADVRECLSLPGGAGGAQATDNWMGGGLGAIT